jgi:hypothetical protein
LASSGLTSIIHCKIIDELKVAIIWETKYTDRLEKIYDEQKEAGNLIAFSRTLKSFRDEDNLSAQEVQVISVSISKIDKHIDNVANKIILRYCTTRKIEDLRLIPKDLYRVAAQRLIESKKKDFVIVAPELWYPTDIPKKPLGPPVLSEISSRS